MMSEDATARGAVRDKARRDREADLTCAWCGEAFTQASTGRPATWCSASCKQRAYEARAAAARGLLAREVVQQDVPKIVERVVTRTQQVPVPHTWVSPASIEQWVEHLDRLTEQIERGRVYDRNLNPIIGASNRLTAALQTRLRYRR